MKTSAPHAKRDAVQADMHVRERLRQARVSHNTGPRNGYGDLEARTEPSVANSGALRLLSTEKPLPVCHLGTNFCTRIP